ncbi:hypothetical protein M405DRAFT_491810 [Rhizopogon salebrosus TDB-379]|nr:hypothetical protein M405DRAFT_491810 [Rhizopogon salebrosus TDB-379]
MSGSLKDGVYRLQSAARPTQYATYFEGEIVGNNGRERPIDFWLVKFHDENSTVTFEFIRDGVESPRKYISYNGKSLVLSENEFYFSYQPSPRAENLKAIGVSTAGGVWTLLSWDNDVPVIIRENHDATEELWVFEFAPVE